MDPSVIWTHSSCWTVARLAWLAPSDIDHTRLLIPLEVQRTIIAEGNLDLLKHLKCG